MPSLVCRLRLLATSVVALTTVVAMVAAVVLATAPSATAATSVAWSFTGK